MSSRALYRKPAGEFEVAVDSAQVIEKGDLVFQSTDDARAASQFTYVTSDLPGTQANFAAQFLGVAEEASANGETRKILVRNRGIYEFDCAAATFEVGDIVGPDDNAGGDALLDQQVIAVGENGYGGIGRVVRRYGSNTTRVLVEICPVNLAPTPIMIPLFQGLITAAADLVTDWAPTFPFKAVRLHSVVTVATTGDGVISVDKGATSLDDTLTIAGGAAVGEVDVAELDDATGDDRFIVGDTLSLKSDGTPTAGEAMFWLEVRPYLMES